jgi:hypothetical protein
LTGVSVSDYYQLTDNEEQDMNSLKAAMIVYQQQQQDEKLKQMLEEQQRLLNSKPLQVKPKKELFGKERESKYFIVNALGETVYIYARSRDKAQQIVDSEFGKGKYSLRVMGVM